MPNEARREQNVAAVLQTAYGLFLAHGIQGTTKEMLVRSSGISRSSLDRYFQSKLDLVLQTARWVGENVRDRNPQIHARLQAPDASGIELLRSYFGILQGLLYENPRLFVLSAECRAFIFRSRDEDASAPEKLRQFLGSSTLLRRIFQRGIRDGSMAPGIDPRTEALFARESALGFFASIALTGDAQLLQNRALTDAFIDRLVAQYRRP